MKDTNDDNYMPIKALNTFTKDWVIKARVSTKQMRDTKAGGKLLKLELVDSYGTAIEATFFNDEAKKFCPMIDENKVYLFSEGMVKLANKRFTTIKNDFCITFSLRTKISEARDDGSISKVAFEFSTIAEIEESIQMKSVDLLCVVIGVGDQDSIKTKDGRTLCKRSIILADHSNASISFTIWGDESCAKFANLKVG